MCITFRYCEQGNAKELGHMMEIRPFTTLLSKARGAKMIRGMVDVYLGMEAATGYEAHLCKWEKRIFPFQVNSTLNLRVLKDFLVFIGSGSPPDRALLRHWQLQSCSC